MSLVRIADRVAIAVLAARCGPSARPRAGRVRARAVLRAHRRARRRVRLLRERVLRRRQPAARKARALVRQGARAALRRGPRAADGGDAPGARPWLGALARAGREQSPQTDEEEMATARDGKLTIRPLTAARVDDVKTVTRGTWGSACWDLFPRYTAAQQRELGINTGGESKRRAVLAKLARRRKNSAGLVAYEGRRADRLDLARAALRLLAHRQLARDTARRRR